MQYETCRHVKEDGIYCGSPALQDRKYCHHHLIARGRRLRRARALREQVPYRMELPALEDLTAVQVALSEIVQALGSGQLDHRAAGKMLYAIQQTTSVIKVRVKFEAAQSRAAQQTAEKPSSTSASYQSAASAAPQAVENTTGFSPCDSATLGGPQLPSVGNCGDQSNAARVQAYPGIEQEFSIKAGEDIDAEIHWTLSKADEEAELRHAEAPPPPPPGIRFGSVQHRLYREENYQGLNMQINRMKLELRDYNAQQRKENEKKIEALKKEMLSATAQPLATSA
jgi:hypothetical protein